MLQLTAYARTLNPGVVVAAGGPAVRALPEHSKQFFDYAMTGDVEDLGDVAEEIFGPGHTAPGILPPLRPGDVVPGGRPTWSRAGTATSGAPSARSRRRGAPTGPTTWTLSAASFSPRARSATTCSSTTTSTATTAPPSSSVSRCSGSSTPTGRSWAGARSSRTTSSRYPRTWNSRSGPGAAGSSAEWSPSRNRPCAGSTSSRTPACRRWR